MGEYKLPNTGDQVAAAIARALSIVVPTHTSQLQNDSGFVTAADVPTKTSQLQNDSGFVLSSDLTTETTRAMTEEARLAGLIASVSAALANYYTKSETYNKTEVNALIAQIKQFTIVIATTLPTASADTMWKIYLVPSTNPETQNVKDEFITIDNGAGAATRYTWEQIGSTALTIETITNAEIDALFS